MKEQFSEADHRHANYACTGVVAWSGVPEPLVAGVLRVCSAVGDHGPLPEGYGPKGESCPSAGQGYIGRGSRQV